MAPADDNLYQQVLLDHARNPRHFGEHSDATLQSEGFNRLCGDRVTVYLEVDGDLIKKASFSGESCAICKGSASIMMEALQGQSLEAIEKLIVSFAKFQDDWLISDERMKPFEALVAVKSCPIRMKCLNLPWKALEAAIKGGDVEVSTE